ncbi:MAG: hypothetical protein M5U09_19760 [Gammaproteobacteria bacterium]|nr:hypothetical protein [Gammaproteobacteria bacterium]
MKNHGVRGVVASLVLAGSFSLPAYGTSHTVSFTFGEGVSEGEQDAVQDAIVIGDALFYAFLNRELTAPIDVFVYADVDDITDAYMAYYGIPLEERPQYRQRWEDNCAGEAGNGVMFQCTLADSRNTNNTGFGVDVDRRKGILHEYVHNLQWEGLTINARPVWLVEGMAEYLAFIYLESVGDSHKAQMSSLYSRALTHSGVLADYEEYTNFDGNGIDLAIAGVHVLVLRFGIDSLMNFFDDLKSTHSWQTSFLNVFGITHTAFYADFESYRAAAFSIGDFDFDGVSDAADEDDDNDGLSDAFEGSNGLDSNDPIDFGWGGLQRGVRRPRPGRNPGYRGSGYRWRRHDQRIRERQRSGSAGSE